MPELRPVFSTVDARDKILSAALDAFAEHGFHGAAMRDIARRAGVSQGLIPHHFGDKESLWNLVGERISEDFLDFIAPALEVDDVTSRSIPNLLEVYMQYWRAHPAALRVQLWRVLGALDAERKLRAERLTERIVPLFKRAQEAGYVRSDIPAGQAMITTGALIQYRLHSVLELACALAVTGETAESDDQFLCYVYSLIAAPPDTE